MVESLTPSLASLGDRVELVPSFPQQRVEDEEGAHIRHVLAKGSVLRIGNVNLASWNPARGQPSLELGIARVGFCGILVKVAESRSKLHTSRNIICDPEHVRDDKNNDKVVEVELGGVPFRRLRSTALFGGRILLYTGVGSGLDNVLVGSGRGRGKAGVEGVMVVELAQES